MPDTIIVAGSHTRERQAALRRLYGRQKQKELLAILLPRELRNPHHANAIQVRMGTLPMDGELDLVGYIPWERADQLAPQMDAGVDVVVTGYRINRDWAKGYPEHIAKLVIEVREPLRVPALSDEERGGF